MSHCAFEFTDPNGCSISFGQYDAHHCVPRQTIKGHYSWWHGLTVAARAAKGLPDTLPLLEEALADRRNLLAICRRHHELVTGCRIYVAPHMLPEGIEAFASEIGVGWYLERYFGNEAYPVEPGPTRAA